MKMCICIRYLPYIFYFNVIFKDVYFVSMFLLEWRCRIKHNISINFLLLLIILVNDIKFRNKVDNITYTYKYSIASLQITTKRRKDYK